MRSSERVAATREGSVNTRFECLKMKCNFNVYLGFILKCSCQANKTIESDLQSWFDSLIIQRDISYLKSGLSFMRVLQLMNE